MCMVAPLCALAADNDNTKVTRTLRARAFNEISVNSGIKVIYTTGKLADFKAEGSRQMLDDLICRIEDGELELRLKRNQQRIMRTGDIVVHITAPAVKDIELNGGSVLVAKNAWSVSPDLDIEVNGGAVFTAMSTVSASEKVSFEVNGGATANVATGAAPEVDVEVNGGAVANISSIQANDIDIESNGGARGQDQRRNCLTGESGCQRRCHSHRERHQGQLSRSGCQRRCRRHRERTCREGIAQR